MAIISNKLNSSVVVHTTANLTLTIAGNNSVSNIATGTEILTGASIKKLIYGSDAGHWSVKRGANVVAILTGTGELNFSSLGTSINLDRTGTVVLTLNGSANGFCMVELSKEGTFTSTY